MRLESSQDFGQTWETLKLFARNCTEMFGLPDDVSQPGAVCTSRYSNAVPCSRGEVRKEIRSPKHHKTSFLNASAGLNEGFSMLWSLFQNSTQ